MNEIILENGNRKAIIRSSLVGGVVVECFINDTMSKKYHLPADQVEATKLAEDFVNESTQKVQLNG